MFNYWCLNHNACVSSKLYFPFSSFTLFFVQHELGFIHLKLSSPKLVGKLAIFKPQGCCLNGETKAMVKILFEVLHLSNSSSYLICDAYLELDTTTNIVFNNIIS